MFYFVIKNNRLKVAILLIPKWGIQQTFTILSLLKWNYPASIQNVSKCINIYAEKPTCKRFSLFYFIVNKIVVFIGGMYGSGR